MKYCKIILLFIVAFNCSCPAVSAQQLTKKGGAAVFHSFNTVQLLNGKAATSAAIHSVNGFQFGKFFTGIGTGFDYYYFTAVPVFMEARYDIAGSGRKLQCFLNGGIYIPYGNNTGRYFYNKGDFKIGRLLAGGFDYLIPIKDDAFIIGIAYSHKQVMQIVNGAIWNPAVNRMEEVTSKDDYQFNRIWIKAGWVF